MDIVCYERLTFVLHCDHKLICYSCCKKFLLHATNIIPCCCSNVPLLWDLKLWTRCGTFVVESVFSLLLIRRQQVKTGRLFRTPYTTRTKYVHPCLLCFVGWKRGRGVFVKEILVCRNKLISFVVLAIVQWLGFRIRGAWDIPSQRIVLLPRNFDKILINCACVFYTNACALLTTKMFSNCVSLIIWL